MTAVLTGEEEMGAGCARWGKGRGDGEGRVATL